MQEAKWGEGQYSCASPAGLHSSAYNAANTKTREEAIKVGREVDGMAVSGVAHTGKRVPHQDRFREIIGVWSSLVRRDKVHHSIKYFES